MPCAAPDVTILDRVRIRQQVRLLEGVRGVLLPAVVGVHGGERRVDAAGREGGMGIRLGALADGEHVDALFGEFDGGAEAGAAGADDEHGGGDLAF